MCGIAGLLDPEGQRPIDPGRLARMTEALRHRGPDGDGTVLRPGLGLGHRRLAIIDLAAGAQPMASADGRTIVTYNGEIYNFQDLRRELEVKGHRFRTRSDTEVLLLGYIEWGTGVLERLRGMFAFAIWDEPARTLFLARDRLGEKPLYYGRDRDGLFLFASEIGALVTGLTSSPELDLEAVADYFTYGYVPDPKSIYRDVRKLAPGHYLLLRPDDATATPRRYWRPQFTDTHRGSIDDLAHELLDRLKESVAMRMIADVPLGAFLSGGVDSSGIVALMAEASPTPVTTCTIGFADPAFDEAPHARTVAQRYATDHHEERVDLDAAGLIDRVAAAYGEPFADSSALPSFVVSQVARRHVKVALTGDGGDEVFAGYRRYPFHLREEAVKAWLPATLRRLVLGPLARAWPRLDWAPRPLRAKATLEALATDTVHGYLRAVTLLPESQRATLFSPDFTRALGGYDPASVLETHAREADTDDPLARAQYMDLMTWLPGRMLVKVDRASMAHGLELRPPLLDHELVEWAAGLPRALKLRGSEGKVLLKHALAPHVPHELLHRPKQGFALPLARWLQESPMLGAAGGGAGWGDAASDFLISSSVTRLMRDHQNRYHDHSTLLWNILAFNRTLACRTSVVGFPSLAAEKA